jgi:hypothetical protein
MIKNHQEWERKADHVAPAEPNAYRKPLQFIREVPIDAGPGATARMDVSQSARSALVERTS